MRWALPARSPIRWLFMDEGRVIEAGTPAAIFDNPQSDRLKHFLAEVL